MSTLSSEAISDMEKTLVALKKGRSVELHIIAPKTSAGAPWVIADKAGKAGPRLQKAVKAARKDDLLNASKVISGRLERIGDQVTFVVPSPGEVAAARQGLGGAWSKSLRSVEAGSGVDITHLKKIAVLLGAASVTSEESFSLGGASAEPTGARSLTPEERREVFGEDADPIQKALPGLAALQETLTVRETLNTTSAAKLKDTIQAALSSSASEVVDQVASAIPDFIAMCATETAGTARSLKVGDTLPLGDVVKSIGSDFLKLLDALTYWEDLLEEARDYGKALSTQEVVAPDTWGDEQRTLYLQTFSSYEKARTQSLRAQGRVTGLRRGLQKRMSAFSTAQKT